MVLPLIAGGLSAAAGIFGANKAAAAQEAASQAQLGMAREQFDAQNELAGDALTKSLGVFDQGNRMAQGIIADRAGGYADPTELRDYTLGQNQNAFGAAGDAFGTAYDRAADAFGGARDAGVNALAGYADGGGNAFDAYNFNLGVGDAPAGYGGLEFTPGAQFALNEGRRNLEGSAAATGDLYSGNTLRELENLRSGTVMMDRDNQMRQLLASANIGAGAASGIAGIEGQYGQNMAGAADVYGQRTAGNAANLAAGNVGAYGAADAGQNMINQERGNALLGQNDAYTSNQANAYNNRANVGTQASQNYANLATDAYGNIGDSRAAGAAGMSTAINSGITNALVSDAYMKGWNPNSGNNPYWTPQPGGLR